MSVVVFQRHCVINVQHALKLRQQKRLVVKAQSVEVAKEELAFFPDRRVVELFKIPSLKNCVHFINLTNGLEALPLLHRLDLHPHFVRIQSTAMEQQNFERTMLDLDATLLLHLALGRTCLLYDYGSRNKKRGASRAIWYGIEFIRYCLAKFWLEEEHSNKARAFLRGYDARASFDAAIKDFSKPAKRKLRYYKQYCPPNLDAIHLYGVYAATERDDDKAYYQDIVRQELLTLPTNNVLLNDTSNTTLQSSNQQLNNSDTKNKNNVDVRQFESHVSVEDLLEGDVHLAAERLLGMRLFLGGLSHKEYTTHFPEYANMK